MFKNRAIQMKVVKTAEIDSDTPRDIRIQIPTEEITTLSHRMTKHATIAVVSIIGAAALAHTISEVIIQNTTPSK